MSGERLCKERVALEQRVLAVGDRGEKGEDIAG
jgi:hypothetical protein